MKECYNIFGTSIYSSNYAKIIKICEQLNFDEDLIIIVNRNE